MALIGPLAWEPPYAEDGALKKAKKKKKIFFWLLLVKMIPLVNDQERMD